MSALLRKHIKKPAKAMQSLVEIAECQTGAAVLRAVDQCRNPDLYTKTFTRNAQPGSAEAEKILRIHLLLAKVIMEELQIVMMILS